MRRVTKPFVMVAVVLLANGLTFAQSSYVEFGNLNNAAVTATTTWTELNTTPGAHTFTKSRDNTTIEVYLNSRLTVGDFKGTNGVHFQVRVDKRTPDVGNLGSITKANTQEFESILAVFRRVPAGKHTVSVWAQAANAGSASSVSVDPGGWGGKLIVKETE